MKKKESEAEAKEPSSVLPAMQRLLVGKSCPHTSIHTQTHAITSINTHIHTKTYKRNYGHTEINAHAHALYLP